MRIDKSLIKNILINLISNVIKSTGENQIIRLTSLIADICLIICVEGGIGISEEGQKHLFERFSERKTPILYRVSVWGF